MLGMVIVIVSRRECLHDLEVTDRNFDGRLKRLRMNLSVHSDLIDVSLDAEVLLRVSFLSQLLSSVGMLIDPFQAVVTRYAIVQ